MGATDAPAGLFFVGVLLVYAAVILLFGIVLKSGSVIPVSRRRPDAVDTTSGLTRLTDVAVGVINKRLRKRNRALVDRDKLEGAGLKSHRLRRRACPSTAPSR